MKLVPVSRERQAINILYDLLAERTPEQSISHKGMPTMAEHTAFVRSLPYRAWYLVQVGNEYVGCVYLSKAREIGVSIFEKRRGNGYATEAVTELMRKWPGRFLANINPANRASIAFFAKLGFQPLQVTYAYRR